MTRTLAQLRHVRACDMTHEERRIVIDAVLAKYPTCPRCGHLLPTEQNAPRDCPKCDPPF